MAFPPQHREPPPGLPSIRVPVSADHFRRHAHSHLNDDMPFGRSVAMSIPGIEVREDAPPPLPPPRMLPMEGAPYETYEHKKNKREYGHSISSSSAASGYGSMDSSFRSDRVDYRRRRDTGDSGIHDEGYSSHPSGDRSLDFPRSEFGILHNRFQLQSPADVISDNMKKKLDPIRTTDRSPPRSLLTSSVNELLPRSAESRFSPTFNMPIHTRGPVLDSPNRMTETPIYSAISPRSAPFQHLPMDHRSPGESSDLDRSPRQRRRNNSDDATSTQSYDYSGADDMEIDEDSSLKRLHIDDAYVATGQKRRAASPAPEDHMMLTAGGQPDLSRRHGASRSSPTPRLTFPQPSSISSFSTAASRSNSYMSTASMAPSSITTSNSFGRRSPGGVSPGGVSPTSCNSPYATPTSLNPSPRGSISSRVPTHTRNPSATSPKRMAEMPKPSKLQDFYMCDCCPKKPKKFESPEQLKLHAQEKQYECHYCGNRFKNKNEAERHQNSLHVRRHSWSCSALSGYDRAFHDSTNRPGEADTCGYCGDEFPRSGRGPGTGVLSGGNAPRHATDQDWDERIKHLQEVHKFRECNSSKKFYRADHFRQHLKHSHAGTSGKWTNMLENACMMDEDPTPR